MLDFERVVQLRVALADDYERVGSGYLIAPRLVLTAAHVLTDATDVTVRIRDTEPAGRVVWSGGETLDAALVELESPAATRTRPVRWGRLTGQQPGVEATAVGFPRALRGEDGVRVPDQIDGAVNPGTGFGQRYDIKLAGTHPLAQANEPSPWSGLSGAAAFSADLLIGVVVIDTPRFQSGRLTAVPAWRLLEHAGFVALLESHGCPVHWESVELAGLFERGFARASSPASLLRADTAIVAFRGRTRDLATAREWCDGEEPVGAWLMAGPGGQGKTRLARQLCQQLRSSGWIAGFLAAERASTDAAALRLRDSRLPVLVVVDYAETRIDQVRGLAEAAADVGQSVRMLLLARSAGEWWTQLRPALRRLEVKAPLQLDALEEAVGGRQDAYRDAVRDLAAGLRRLPGRGDRDWQAIAHALDAPPLSADAFASVLTIQLQALLDLLTADVPDGADVAPEELEDALLEHEQLYWQQTAAQRGLTEPAFQPVTLRRAVATAALCGADDEDEAIATVSRVPGLSDKTSDERRGVAGWLHDLYPAGEARYWGPIQPDRIGEHLVGAVARERADLLSTVLTQASREQRTLALTVLARAVTHQTHVADQLRDLLIADLPTYGPLAVATAIAASRPDPILAAIRAAIEVTTDPADLHSTYAALPKRSVTFLDFTLDVATRLASLYRRRPAAGPDLAAALNNLSVRLGEAGRYDESLAVIEEAVGIYRRLAGADAAAYEPDLAGALMNLGGQLSAKAQIDEALVAIEEAVRIYRRLATTDPAGYAGALNNLAGNLAAAGRRDEALAASEEAVSIYRRLAIDDGLGRSLNALYRRLGEAERHGEALAAIEEAVTIFRRLAIVDPDVYAPDLARTLSNFVTALSAADRHDEALIASADAVEVRRRLAAAHPAFVPAFATSLNDHAVLLERAGRREESLAVSDEAVAVHRWLASTDAGTYEPKLANSLSQLGQRLMQAHRFEAGLAASGETVVIRRRLADADSAAYAPALATSLHNLSIALFAMQRREEALAVTDEAIDGYRRLAAADPATYATKLASSMNFRSFQLSERPQ